MSKYVIEKLSSILGKQVTEKNVYLLGIVACEVLLAFTVFDTRTKYTFGSVYSSLFVDKVYL